MEQLAGLDLWRGYARRCGFPFPEPPTDEAVVQLARDLLLFALPALTDDTPTTDDDFKDVVRTVYEPTVLGDLDSIEQEILTNPELADGDWPDDFRADLPYNIDLFLWCASDQQNRVPRAVVLAARRLEWLCKVLTREEIALLLEAA